MLKLRTKLSILFNDIIYILFYRLGLKKKPLIIWGRSPYLEFGPGIRTRRLKNLIEKEAINKICIYMQSHWPFYDILLYTLLAKFLNIKIIFNQNGIFSKEYKKYHKIHNFILIFGILNSDHIIYQSWYCYESIIKIAPHFIKNLIKLKKYNRMLNPTINFAKNISPSSPKRHKILIRNAFTKSNSYYSNYIYKLSQKLINQRSIKEINIVGNIQENINNDKFKNILNSKKINLYYELENKKLLEIIKQNSIVIHLNYGDACPNFISEVISFGVPCILNKVGGGKEIALNACICPNNIYLEGKEMPDFSDVLKSISVLIKNYSQYKKFAIKRAEKLNIKKYVKSHLNIINN